MNTDDKPTTQKAHPDPAKEEALSHPNGPGLLEMIDGKENNTPKKKQTENNGPENGPIPVI